MPANVAEARRFALVTRAATGLLVAFAGWLLGLAAAEWLRAGGVRDAAASLPGWVVAALAGFALFIAVRGGRRRAPAAVVAASAAAAALLVEGVLHGAAGDPRAVVARRMRRDYDARPALAVLDSLRRSGVDAWPALIPTLAWGVFEGPGSNVPWPDTAPPLSGLPRVTTVFCNESAQFTAYRSDALGYNNTGAPDTPVRGGVAVLGDSYVHGACVPAESGLVAQLRSWHDDVRGFGQGGFGPLLYLATLREVVDSLSPRIVVWCHFEGNDLSNLHVERAQPQLAAYLDPGHKVGLWPRDDGRLRRWFEEVRRHEQRRRNVTVASRVINALLLSRLRDGLRPYRPAGPDPDAADVELLGRVLDTARREVRARGGELVFVYLPAWERFFAPAALAARRDEVLATVRAAGIRVVDVEPLFAGAPSAERLFSRGRWMPAHYSSDGYRVAAQAIARHLSANQATHTVGRAE